jgi:hypothetical protein
MADDHDVEICTRATKGRMVQSFAEMDQFLADSPFHLHRATPYNHGTASSNDTTDGPQWIIYCEG